MIDTDPTIVTKRETRTLKTTLTRDERLQAAEELAQTIQEIDRLENEKKAAAESFQHQISESKARRGRLTDVVSSGHDWRSVDCSRELDFDRKRVRVVRLDTGEVVEDRSMYESELQQRLPIE